MPPPIPTDPADYSTDNGICSDVFGPSAWWFLYCVAANSPMRPTAADKARALEFLKSFQGVLPCGKCRTNFCRNFHDVVATSFSGDVLLALRDRDAFFRFIYLLHENVHKQQHKGKLPFTLDHARLTVESVRARDCKSGEGCQNERRPCRLHLEIRPKTADDTHNPFHIDPTCLLQLRKESGSGNSRSKN